MIAKNIIANEILPLRTSDSGHYALSIMNEYYIKHLPIVNDEELLGVLSEDDLLEHNADEAIGSYNLSMRRPYVKADDHLFDLMRVMYEYDLSIVPVIEGDNTYIGMVTLDDLLKYYASSYSFSEPGSIIVLEMAKTDYSLSEISQIIESEGAVILSSFITSDPSTSQVIVTIKVNNKEIGTMVASLERYSYTIKGVFTETAYVDAMKERYDALMSYLNV